MFWALAQIEKDRKTFREEGRAEGEAVGRQELAWQIREAADKSGRFLPKEVDQILAQVFNGESGNHQSAAPGARRTNTRRRRRRK